MGPLRLVHGDVRTLEEVFPSPAVLGVKRDADAGADVQPMVVDQHGGSEALLDLLRDQNGFLGGGARQEDGELVSTQACHGVRLPHGRPQFRAQPLQEHVSGVVPQGIIDDLELIEIE